MNHYEAKQENRRERLERAAARADRMADAMHKRSNDYVAGIPFGQPILVGHHSERGHRRALEKSWNAMGRFVQLSKRAEQLRGMAHAVGSAGVSSDDLDAVKKLDLKLKGLEVAQTVMKEANQHVHAYFRILKRGGYYATDEGKAEAREAVIARLMALELPAPDRLLEPDFCGRFGFPDYALKNNNAEIRRLKLRIEQLRQQPTESCERMRGDVRVVENAYANRLQLFFPAKPSAEVRTLLKRNGFRWAPSEGAWQRQLNNAARYAEQQVFA